MAAKQMLFDDEARAPLAAGVEKLARAVRSTLGPRGRNAVLDKGWGSPKVTKDGVTVAEDIELDDPFENLGAQLVKEAASKTNDVAGDGTTTATVLAEGIFREGLKMIAAGADPMALSRGINKAVAAVNEAIDKQAEKVDVKDKKSLQQIATIAGNNDPSIGNVLADAFMKVGKDGVITVEEGRSSETTVEVVEGMQFDRGFLSPHFVTNPGRARSRARKLPDPRSTKRRFRSAKNLVPLLEAVSQGRQAAVDHRRRRRRRSPGDAGGQQAPRHSASLCRKGPRLRRSPQGDARRHRHAHRRQPPSSKTSASSSTASSLPISARPRRSPSTATTPRSSAAAARRTPSTAVPSRFATRSKTPTAITIARSCKSGWRSWPAAWPRSKSAPRPKPK